MALAFRSASSNSASSGSDANVGAPSGMSDGDWIVVVVQGNGQITINDDNGSTPFTKAPNFSDYKPNTTNGHTITVFYRRKQSGDPTTFHFALSTGGRWAVDAMAFSGNTVDFDVAPSTANAANEDDSSDGSIDAPSISVAADTIHVVFCGWDTSEIGTITTPSGYTLIANANGGGEPLHASRKAFASAGSTGAVTCSNTEFGAKIAGSFSVKETASGGTATPSVATIALSAIAATVMGGASIVAAIANAVFSIPTPTPSGMASITPTVQTSVFSVQSQAAKGGANVFPSVGVSIFSVQAPTQSGGGVVTPGVAGASFSAPVASASGGGGSASATPLESSALFSIVSPSVSSGGKAQAITASAVLSSISPSLYGSATKSVAEAQFSASIQSPSVIGSGNVSASVASSAFSLVPVVPSGGAAITANISSSLFSTPTPAVTGGSSSCTVYPKTVVIGPYDLIFLPSSGKLAKRITGNFYLEL